MLRPPKNTCDEYKCDSSENAGVSESNSNRSLVHEGVWCQDAADALRVVHAVRSEDDAAGAEEHLVCKGYSSLQLSKDSLRVEQTTIRHAARPVQGMWSAACRGRGGAPRAASACGMVD